MASTNLPELKVILCGEYGVGKTSIFRRFTNDSFIDLTNKSSFECRQSTLGLDCYSRTFDVPESGRHVRLQLWDTGGLERVASVTTSYYKFAEAALLVFSMNSIDSFHSLSHHLLEIMSFAEQAKICLIANKVDLTPHEVTDEDIQLFLEQFPKVSGVWRISCKQNIGVQSMFEDLSCKLASSNLRQKQMDALRLHSAQRRSESGYDLDEDDRSCCAK